MTKEVDLLTSTKTIEKSKDQTATKKEGNSLFDSILSNAKNKSTEVKNENEIKSEKVSTPDKLKDDETKTSTLNTSENSSKKSLEESKNKLESKVENKTTDTKNETSKEAKVQDATNKNSTSLLDRLVVEAKVAIKQEETPKIIEDKSNKVKNDKIKESIVSNQEDVKVDKKEEQKTVVKDNIEKNLQELGEKETATQTKVVDTKINEKEQKSLNKESVPNNEKEEVSLKENTLDNKIKDTQKTPIENKLQENTNQSEKRVVDEKDDLKSIKKNNSSKNEKDELTNSKVIKDEKSTLNTPLTLQNAQANDTVIPNELMTKDSNNEEITQKKTTLVKEEKVIDAKDNKSEVLRDNKTLETKTTRNEQEFSKNLNESKETQPKNEKVANELAKLNSQADNEKVNITKDNSQQTQNKKESLLDKLVNESKQEISNKDEKTATAQNIKTAEEPARDSKNSVLTNMYLSTQKKEVSQKALEVGHEGKELAKNAKSVDDIKQSAKVLDLGLESTKLDVKNLEEKQVQDKALDRLAFVKNVMNDNLQKVDAVITATKSHQVASATTQSSSSETVVQISVAPSLVQSMESRIIGARQQMSTMMSDVAREMYNNYKPPVTSFRINLLPSHLGSISIMMKSDRENGISISMSMSNNATLDAMNESQNMLRSALAKNFSEDTSFSLDFGMQNDSSAQDGHQDSSTNRQQTSSEESVSNQNITTEQDSEQTTNYM